MKILKIILYWIMVALIVTGAVYSYQKVRFGNKVAIIYQLATGQTVTNGRPGMGGEGGQGSSGERGMQGAPGQYVQGGQIPGTTSGTDQGQNRMQGEQTGMGRGGEEYGGMQSHGGMNGAGDGSWYKISLSTIGPYTCLLAFFILITCMIEKGIKMMPRKKASC